MELKLGYSININGAQIIPNQAQHEKLITAITEIVLGEKPTGFYDNSDEDLGTPKVKRQYTKRNKKSRYTPGEDNLIINRKLEGVKWKKIAHEMQVVFGTKRSIGALFQRYTVLMAKKPAPVTDEVKPTDQRTILRPNEWGGTDGVQAHNLA